MRPTHFISLQIPVTDASRAFYANVLTKNKALMRDQAARKIRVIPPAEYHITLLVLTITSQKQQEETVAIFNSLIRVFKIYFPPRDPLRIDLKGLHQFERGDVVFTAPEPSPVLSRLSSVQKEIVAAFHTAFDYKPHVTVSKWGILPPQLLEEGRMYSFGDHELHRLDLSIMKGKKAEDGYYRSAARFYF